MYPNSGDWYDGMLVILSLRYVVNARMFVEVGRGCSVGSVPIVLTASSYEIGGTNLLGIGDGTCGGTTPAIGSSPSPSDDVMLPVALFSANCLVTCCYLGCAGVVGWTILMVSPFFLGFFTVLSIRTSN